MHVQGMAHMVGGCCCALALLYPSLQGIQKGADKARLMWNVGNGLLLTDWHECMLHELDSMHGLHSSSFGSHQSQLTNILLHSLLFYGLTNAPLNLLPCL